MPDDNLLMDSGRWRATHKASVIAILGSDAPEVVSKGARFYNVDRWTSRTLVNNICEWAKKNPGACPTRLDVVGWVEAANTAPLPVRRIVIASTPPKLTYTVAMALVGGGYHEALHTKYSCRRDLLVNEVCDIVLPRWAKVPDWAPLANLLLDWGNIVEDIRIERLGNETFRGIYDRMCTLQDFILQQEASACRNAVAKFGKKGQAACNKALTIVSATFRDMGLGYDTFEQREALTSYRDRNPAAVDLVENGPLRPFLDEAIALSPTDDLGSLRLSMSIIVELLHLIDPEEIKQAQATNGPPKCPQCGAPAKDLLARPVSNGSGGVIKGKVIITCTKCGWQVMTDVTDGGLKSGAGSSGASEASDEEDGGSDNDSIPFDPIPLDLGGEDVEGEGVASVPLDAPGEAAGNTGEEGDDTGEGGADDDEAGDEEGTDTGFGADGDPTSEADSQGDPGSGAGGHLFDPERAKGWELTAEHVVEEAAAGQSNELQDLTKALETAFKDEQKRLDKSCAADERPWRPFNETLDTVDVVQPSAKGLEDDKRRAEKIAASVRDECSYLRARLRAIVRAVEQRDVVHGTPRGRDLSERMLVDTVADLRGGERPRRAYYVVGDQVNTSIAAVTVIDQSGSMDGQILVDATRVLVAITEPLDFLGAATFVAGFRDGKEMSCEDIREAFQFDPGHYHRYHGVHMDVFKNFDERFNTVRWRFANTRAGGGTPMSDGIQFGLDVLRTRKEAHRLLFVVTDGKPNLGHEPVIRHQVRVAKGNHVSVLGVGIGKASRSVMALFDDHIWAEKVGDLPVEIVSKLNDLLDLRGIKRRRS